jgi:acyl-CoA thioesterase FadM
MSVAIEHGIHEYRADVRPEWIDENDHMNVTYYVTVFTDAAWALLEGCGVEAPTPEGHSIVTAELHVRYLNEAKVGDPLLVRTRLIGVDAKRCHFFHEMVNADDGTRLATCEEMELRVDLNGPRVVPFSDEVQMRLRAAHEAQRTLPMPEDVGRRVSMQRQ